MLSSLRPLLVRIQSVCRADAQSALRIPFHQFSVVQTNEADIAMHFNQ